MSRTSSPDPPLLAAALVALSAGRYARFVLGDLQEEFNLLERTQGGRAARLWYWNQALHSFGSLLIARAARSAGATAAGALTAVVTATLCGVLLGELGLCTELPLPWITAGVTAVALLSSTCAGYVSRWTAGGRDLAAFLLIGFVIVAPEVAYAARTEAAPLELLPLATAVLATCMGLLLSGRVWSFVHHPASSGDI